MVGTKFNLTSPIDYLRFVLVLNLIFVDERFINLVGVVKRSAVKLPTV